MSGEGREKGLGKGSAPEGGGHETGCPGQWARPQAVGVQGVFGHRSQIQGLNFDWPFVEPEAGLNDPCGFVPTEDIL